MVALLRRNPRFRRLWLAHATSRAGDAFNTVALVVLVYRLTGTGRGVAATVAFEVLPLVLLGPVAGIVADRYPRRRVMVLADLGRAALAGVIVVAHGRVALAYAVAFGLSVGTMLFNPSASSVVPETVGDDELVDANSALWTVAVVAQILLAPAAGALISVAGVGAAFAVNAASYLGSAWWLSRLDAGRTPAAHTARGWRAAGEGVRAAASSPLLTRLAVVQVLASLSAGATSGLLVVLAADLGVGPGGFGLLLAAIGLGAASGPLLLRRFIRAGDRRALFGPFVLRGAVDLSLAVAGQPLVAGAALGLYGVGTSTGMVAYQSTLQSAVAPAVRGRVFAFYDVLWNATRLVSLGAGGLLADALSIRAVYAIGGALLLAAAAVGFTAPSEGGRVAGPAGASAPAGRPVPGEPPAER